MWLRSETLGINQIIVLLTREHCVGSGSNVTLLLIITLLSLQGQSGFVASHMASERLFTCVTWREATFPLTHHIGLLRK